MRSTEIDAEGFAYAVSLIDRGLADIDLATAWMDRNWYVRQAAAAGHGDGLTEDTAAEHYLSVGAAAGLEPHPLFSSRFYGDRNRDLPVDPISRFAHYIRAGLIEGRRAHPALQALPDHLSLWPGDEAPVPAATSLFDSTYYRSQHASLPADTAPIVHYLHYGVLAGASPNGLFEPDFDPPPPELAPLSGALAEYLVSGAAAGRLASPLFDARYYAQQCGIPAGDSLLHFLENKADSISPHPAFDLAYFASAIDRRRSRPGAHPLVRYLSEPGLWMTSPHRLFDPAFYRNQIDEAIDEPLLVHYLRYGWRIGLSPHPLIDPQTCAASLKAQGFSAKTSPLVGYLEAPRTTKPHYLFDSQSVTDALGEADYPALIRYLDHESDLNVSPHPMFDPEVYLRSLRTRCSPPELRRRPKHHRELVTDDIFADARLYPLRHYLTVGWKLRATPFPLFDPDFYVVEADVSDEDPLASYLRDGGMSRFSPTPTFHLATYLSGEPELDPASEIAPVHYLRMAPQQRTSPVPGFDRRYYLDTNPDVAASRMDPLLHFLISGAREGRSPNGIFSPEYVVRTVRTKMRTDEAPFEYYLRVRRERPWVIFVGHDANRNGAPLILLKLVQALARELDCEFLTILASGGELEDDFRKVSHVFSASIGRDEMFRSTGKFHDPVWMRALSEALGLMLPDVPVTVLCNTVETCAFVEEFSSNGVAVIALIHEPPDPYLPQQFRAVYEGAKTVIFPSHYVANRLHTRLGFVPSRAIIRGQGLLQDRSRRADPALARMTIRSELGIPADAPIILGCGTIDRRKGVDLFVDVAMKVANSDPKAMFLWVGTGSHDYDSAYYYIEERLKREATASRIRFVGACPDPSYYYLAADMFLLTSRLDPFPCVVHEAMAARLPIIAFDGASGGPEAFADAGIVVPAFDTDEMARAVTALLADVGHRNTLGARAVEIVQSTWRFDTYVADVLSEMQLAAEHALPSLPGKETTRPAVFFLQPDWSISGVNTFTETLVEDLRTRGLDARIIWTRGRYTEMLEGHSPTCPTFDVEPSLNRPDRVWSSLADFLSKQQPCIVIPNYDYVASSVALLLPPGVGIIGIVHSDDVEHYVHAYRLGHYWNRIIAVSERIGIELGAMNPSFADRIKVIRYGVPFDEEYALGKVAERLSALEAQVDRPIHIIYTGRLEYKQKQVLRFADLARALLKAHIPFRLTLVGEGGAEVALRQQLAPLIDGGIVRMPGRLSPQAISKELAVADVFVLLSDYEGLPLSLLEAMAHGVIPVVRDVRSGVREVLEDGVNGWITPADDLGGLVARLELLRRDTEQRVRMSKAAIDTIKRKGLSRQSMADSYFHEITAVFRELDEQQTGVRRDFNINPDRKLVVAEWLYPTIDESRL